MTLRQTIDAWNDEEEVNEEHHQQDTTNNDTTDLPLQENVDNVEEPPPGLSRPASIAGSASTVIMSTLELPLFKGSFQESRGRPTQDSCTGKGSGFTQARTQDHCGTIRSSFWVIKREIMQRFKKCSKPWMWVQGRRHTRLPPLWWPQWRGREMLWLRWPTRTGTNREVHCDSGITNITW